jgi:BCD family chlorophyll transporter-like MFS transporter
MNATSAKLIQGFKRLSPEFLPFADAATEELPLGRLLRLSLFQVTVGMAAVLMIGTLNRVMIVELEVPSWIVALMLALPLLSAPLRTLIGFRSDNHRSVLGWRRVPFIWFGTLAQFGGFAIMPFALLILSGDTTGPLWAGDVAAALAFLLVGGGLHTVQTVGLALATDLAPERARPKVVALLCAMLLVGMAISALIFGVLLRHFSEVRLIQVVQGAAVVTMALNSIALWKQEPRTSLKTVEPQRRVGFFRAWDSFSQSGRTRRRLTAIALGTAGFSMQDILLEPYGGKILHLPVGATTALTAMLAFGGGLGLWLAAQRLARGADPHRIAGFGAAVGVIAFAFVMFAAPLESGEVFGVGVGLIGFGGGLFAHGTLTASMNAARPEDRGLALGAWGAAQATAAGLAIAASGMINDAGSALAVSGAFGEPLADPVTGYILVYGLEILLLLATVIAIGPLTRGRRSTELTLENSIGFNPGSLP